MAEKDKHDLVLLNIEYAIIHPMLENVDDNVRKESVQKDQADLATEYAAIRPVSENVGDNLLKDTAVRQRQETEEEILKRIADLFLARPAYSKDKCKISWDVNKGDREMTSRKIKKGKKKVRKYNVMFFLVRNKQTKYNR